MSTVLRHGLRRGEQRSALATLVELHQVTSDDVTGTQCATGYSPLDEVLAGGVRPGEMLLVGGRPGVGKTVACLDWARHAARQGQVAVYVCYEHDPVVLVARLLACELGEAALIDGRHLDPTLDELRARLRDVAAGSLSLREALASDPLLVQAERRLAAYGDRLVIHQGSGSRSDVGALCDALNRFAGEACVLFVDYVQKVPVLPAGSVSGAERIGHVIESLKELALDYGLPVVAISSSDRRGLTSPRVHLHHFVGSAALAYEADVVIVLNEKVDVVSEAHVARSSTQIDDIRRQVVFSIEKNRNGASDVTLEFTKDFEHYRFDPEGAWLSDE